MAERANNQCLFTPIINSDPQEVFAFQQVKNGGTAVNTGTNVANGTAVIYAVAASRELCLTSIAWGYDSNVAGYGHIAIRNGVGVTQYYLQRFRTHNGFSRQNYHLYIPALVIPTTWGVEIHSNNANLRVECEIHGTLFVV